MFEIMTAFDMASGTGAQAATCHFMWPGGRGLFEFDFAAAGGATLELNGEEAFVLDGVAKGVGPVTVSGSQLVVVEADVGSVFRFDVNVPAAATMTITRVGFWPL